MGIWLVAMAVASLVAVLELLRSLKSLKCEFAPAEEYNESIHLLV